MFDILILCVTKGPTRHLGEDRGPHDAYLYTKSKGKLVAVFTWTTHHDSIQREQTYSSKISEPRL